MYRRNRQRSSLLFAVAIQFLAVLAILHLNNFEEEDEFYGSRESDGFSGKICSSSYAAAIQRTDWSQGYQVVLNHRSQ